MNAIAIIKCPNANQSVPQAMNGYLAFVSISQSRTVTIQCKSPVVFSGVVFSDASRILARSDTYHSSGNAVNPLKISPMVNAISRTLILPSSFFCFIIALPLTEYHRKMPAVN